MEKRKQSPEKEKKKTDKGGEKEKEADKSTEAVKHVCEVDWE